MKSCFPLLSASLAVLALAACSPSTPASDTSASVSETAAATMAVDDATEPMVTESVASSAATVVVAQAETYDPVVIRQMGQKPGYWEVKHTDPKTRKSYVTHVCVDKTLGAKMTKQGPVSAPADRRDYKDDANFKGACPTGVQGGDVQKSDGNKVNAYGDHKPGQNYDSQNHDSQNHDSKNMSNGGDIHGDKRNDQKPSTESNHSHTSAEPSHNPHTTPAEDHANDQRHDSSSSRPGENRG